MEKKLHRGVILYARICLPNDRFIKTEMKRLGYKSKSEFIDQVLTERRTGKDLPNGCHDDKLPRGSKAP